MKKIYLRSATFLLSCVTFLAIHLFLMSPSQAHWADLATADIKIGQTSTEMLLTIPTGLVAEADTDRNGTLSPIEINQNQTLLQTQLASKIQFTNERNQSGTLQVSPATETSEIPSSSSIGTTSRNENRTTIKLTYAWQNSIEGVKINYALFAPDAPAARCITTLHHNKTVKNVIFSPDNQSVTSFPNSTLNLSNGIWVTIVGAFLWGAAHAMSPGHGKTLVGAYLMGEKATLRHALFLGLTTTVTHTLGVFALGGVTLLASKTVLPEQLFPWMSLLSGLLVVAIGTNLLRDRLKQSKRHQHHHSHHEHSHHEHHQHSHDEHHHHEHSHSEHNHSEHSHGGHHGHSHLPPEETSWKNLLALGISGGLIPCPSALLLLLSSIALGQVGYGLILVLSFSLGLAGVLTGLGLLLISSKHLFIKLPIENWTQASGLQWLMKLVPIGTAFAITLIGFIMSMQALSQIGMIKLS
jgi:nickel/cobalt transporter (NicO) family protein